MYQTILFDLDGTITDSAPGIINSAAYALNKFGIAVEDRSSLRRFIGPPLQQSFMQFYGLSADEGKLGIKYYREYYTDKGIFENALYDGIPELLRELKAAGKRVLLATSKPEVFAVQILEHFGVAQHFDRIAGATLDEKRVEKPDVIAYALESAGTTDLTQTVMVGDRKHDILGAKQFGMDSIGVLYGYGDRAELQNAGATHIVDSVAALGELLFQSHS